MLKISLTLKTLISKKLLKALSTTLKFGRKQYQTHCFFFSSTKLESCHQYTRSQILVLAWKYNFNQIWLIWKTLCVLLKPALVEQLNALSRIEVYVLRSIYNLYFLASWRFWIYKCDIVNLFWLCSQGTRWRITRTILSQQKIVITTTFPEIALSFTEVLGGLGTTSIATQAIWTVSTTLLHPKKTGKV